MNLQRRADVLKRLETRQLTEALDQAIVEYVAILDEEADFVFRNRKHLVGRSGDSESVGIKLAELTFNTPEFSESGNKFTAKERDAWLLRQRKDNPDLATLLQAQYDTDYKLRQIQARREAISKRITALEARIRLRTAQIKFLGGAQ